MYLLAENWDQLGNLIIGFVYYLNIGFAFDRYLFQLIVLLKPDFNCWNCFTYLELIKLQPEHKVLYQLLQMLVPNCQ